MKTKVRTFTVLCLCALALTGCGDKIMDFRNAEIASGKMYRQGADEPFSGKVTNVPLERLIDRHPGYFKVMPVAFVGTGTPAPGLVFQGLQVYSSGLFALCDAEFTDGQMDGAMSCRKEKTNEKLLDIQFDKGMLSGPFTFYTNQASASITFKQGMPEGVLTVKVSKTDKPVHTYTFQGGKLNGREEVLNEETGAVTSYANYENGLLEGEVARFTPDGKQMIYLATMVNNLQDGPEKFFYPSGKLMKTGQWSKGMPQGRFQFYDEQGSVTQEEVWKDGVKQNPNANTPELCLDEKIKAFREENGDEQPIMHDVMMDWEGECGLPATGYN